MSTSSSARASDRSKLGPDLLFDLLLLPTTSGAWQHDREPGALSSKYEHGRANSSMAPKRKRDPGSRTDHGPSTGQSSRSDAIRPESSTSGGLRKIISISSDEEEDCRRPASSKTTKASIEEVSGGSPGRCTSAVLDGAGDIIMHEASKFGVRTAPKTSAPIELDMTDEEDGLASDHLPTDDELEIIVPGPPSRRGGRSAFPTPPASHAGSVDPAPVSKAGPKMSPRDRWLSDCALGRSMWGRDGGVIRKFTVPNEETCEFSVPHPANPKRSLRLTLMATDPSAYMTEDHQFFCCSDSSNIPAPVQAVIDALCEDAAGKGSIAQAVGFLARGVARHIAEPGTSRLIERALEPARISNVAASRGHGLQRAKISTKSVLDEEDDGQDETYDELFGLGTEVVTGPSEATKVALQLDFTQIVAEGYRPGFTSTADGCIISVACKVGKTGVGLAALRAWDSRFLGKSGKWYLVLLIKLRGAYPIDFDDLDPSKASFAIGLSPTYKPPAEACTNAFRQHSNTMGSWTAEAFEAFALSKPLMSVMNETFLQTLVLRRQDQSRFAGRSGTASKGKDRQGQVLPGMGWAGAEAVCSKQKSRARDAPPSQEPEHHANEADWVERSISENYKLPPDFLALEAFMGNFPLIAFGYVLRRFAMCPLFCLVCQAQVNLQYAPLKPYVCDSPLCLYQYMSLGLGPSVEYEIVSNPEVVDLLVQMAYLSAKGQVMHEHPVGLGIEAPPPQKFDWLPGLPTVDFDTLTPEHRNWAIAKLLDHLPAISEMRDWLVGKGMTADEERLQKVRKMVDMKNGTVAKSAFQLLRWIIASNTSYLRPIESTEDQLNVGAEYRQLEFISGAPDKEYKLATCVKEVQRRDPNAVNYPLLYAWHGSPAKNWHTILREGLNTKRISHGRTYGNGVYFALDAATSLGGYAQLAEGAWPQAEEPISKIVAVCAVVNSPKDFVSRNPHIVVDKLDWIQARYLLVSCKSRWQAPPKASKAKVPQPINEESACSVVKMDPSFRISIERRDLKIPDVIPKLKALEAEMRQSAEDPTDSIDQAVLDFTPAQSSSKISKEKAVKEPEWETAVSSAMKHIRLLPPPSNATSAATSALMREVKAIMAVQAREAPSFRGWAFDPETTNGNAYQWVVEFFWISPEDAALPLVQDMTRHSVKSIVLEVRFSPSFPFSPPFVRVCWPRFLPFAQGGGGHVTAGGSICMDLLTTSGWSASYSLDNVLLQVRMAMGSTEPKPARLDPRSWNTAYGMHEAIEGFKRSAAAHGWEVPQDLASMTWM